MICFYCHLSSQLSSQSLRISQTLLFQTHYLSRKMLSLRPALLRPITSLTRQASTLVLAEHDNAKLSPVTLHAITAANSVGGDITCLVAGTKCADVAKEVAGVKGVTKVSDGLSSELSFPLYLEGFGC